MPIVLLQPNSTISNDIPASGYPTGMSPHDVIGDSSFLTRMRQVHSGIGTLTRVGLDTYALQTNERIRGIRILLSLGQTHPAMIYAMLNNNLQASFGIWSKVPFPTAPRLPFVSNWITKDPSNNTEWTQTDLDNLEMYIHWGNPGGTFDARLYDAAIQVDVAPQPVVQNVTPGVSATIDQDRPRFRWNVDQEGAAVQNRFELKVFNPSVAEDVAFDAATSEYYAFLSKITSLKQADLLAPQLALLYGKKFYFSVRAAVKFLDQLWWSEWSEPTPFQLNDPPTVDVLTPSGAVTDTNKPLVTWDYTDPQLNAQASAVIAVFEEPVSGFWGENLLPDSQDDADDYHPVTEFVPASSVVLSKAGSRGDRVLRTTRSGTTGSTTVRSSTGLNGVPVSPSTQYTVTVEVKAATVGRSCRVGITQYDAAGASIVTSFGGTVVDTTTGWTKLTFSNVISASAAFAAICFEAQSVPVGEFHDWRRMALIRGNVTDWKPAGQGYPDFFDTHEEAEAAGRKFLGLILDDTEEIQVTERLANLENYRTYVQAAHRLVDGTLLASPWSYEEFNTNYTPPPAPTLTVHKHNDRVMLKLTPTTPGGGEPPIAFLRIECSLDGGITWEPFRYGTAYTTAELPVSTATYFHYEVPLFKDLQYRAYAVSNNLGVEIYSLASTPDPIKLEHHRVTIIDPLDATLNKAFPVEGSWLVVNRRRSRSFHQAMGRKKPIVIRGAADSESFDTVLMVVGEDQWDNLLDLIGNRTLFIQTPKGSWYVDVASDITHEDRLWDRRQGEEDIYKVTISWQEVDYARS